MTLDDVRAWCTRLPGHVEAPHHHFLSFRQGTRIYATAPPEGTHLHVMLGDDGHGAAAAHPAFAEELWWGRSLAGVRVRLEDADPDVVYGWLEAAWAKKAPARVVAAWRARS